MYLILCACAGHSAAESRIQCAVDAIGADSLVKIDDAQMRFFIVRNQVDVQSLNPLIEKMEACLSQHPWKNRWSLSVFSDKTLLDLDKSTPVGYYFERQSYILEKLQKLNYSDRIIKINPLPAFCDGYYCSAMKDGQALYIDDDHPSLFGTKRIVNLMDL